MGAPWHPKGAELLREEMAVVCGDGLVVGNGLFVVAAGGCIPCGIEDL